ncbi:uncharacterized protein K441DRAFT_424017, partial [Cenococcum geophilum 1.58]|uniref:uncharacterized protein n=1 Tax=Cenococcum geophilum 1.58 TaxID=794803 RepID=UPI00358F89F5
MSGNPFRISLQQQQQQEPAINPTSTFLTLDTTSGRADASGQPIDTVRSSPKPLKTKRVVRIESPASPSPQPGFPDTEDVLLQRLNRGGHIGSPPPASPTTSSDSAEESLGDPFNRDTDGEGDGKEDDELVRNTRTNSAMEEKASESTSTIVPVNPFQKTLATMEPSVKVATLHREALFDRPTPERMGSGTTRASLDVDAFKRLLMTGNTNPSGSGTPSSQPVLQNSISGAILESSSSTDTSSISRQSIFEPIHETHTESPRTSYETAGSDDDETASLMTEGRKIEKKKPPPPKHRHGKLVASRTPQTVSFADFSPSFALPTPQNPSSPGAPTSPQLNKTNSDLNKPLPPPPDASSPPSEPQESQKEP